MCPGDSHRAEPGRETDTPQAHWNWDEHQRQETTRKRESWTWGSNQTGQPKQLPENRVASARSDDCDSGFEDDCIQTNSDATVRPATLPEGWTVVLNSLRQIESGIACFQMPENPELPNDLKFENGSSSGSGELSQKRRSDCKRSVSNHPEHNKLNISRGHHPQCCSHYVENQVMVKSPSCWIDPFQAKLDKRRTTKLTRTAEPLSRDVIEMKQAALWHGGKIRIDQACEDAAQGMARQPKVPRISFRSDVPMEAAMPRKMRVKKQLKLRETFSESWESNKIQKTKLHVSWKLMNLRDSVWNPLCQKIMKNTSHAKDTLWWAIYNLVHKFIPKLKR